MTQQEESNVQYELLLRAESMELSELLSCVERSRENLEMTRLDEGTYSLRIKEGGRAILALYTPAGEPDRESKPRKGLDFKVPFGLLLDQSKEYFKLCLSIGRNKEMTVYDPQLGREVLELDLDEILRSYKEKNLFLLHTVGLEGTLDGGAHYPEYKTGLGAMSIFWLVVGGTILGLLILIKMCS